MSKLRRALLVVGVIAALPLGAWIWREITVDRLWKDTAVRVERLREDAMRRQPADGGADWADYDAALRLILSSKDPHHADVDDRVFRHLRAASRGPAVRPERSTLSDHILAPFAAIQNLSLNRSREELSKGRVREAAETLLDLLRLSQNLSVLGVPDIELHVMDLTRTTLDDLQALIKGPSTSSEDLSFIEAGLEALDRRAPPYFQGDLWDVVAFGELLLSGKPLPNAEARHARYLYSERLMKASAYAEAEDLIRLALRVEDKPYAEATRELTALFEGPRTSRNPLTKGWVTPYSGRLKREQRAELRLLRMAARFRRTGEMLDLEDPRGDRLSHERSGHGMKAWSACGLTIEISR